VLIHITLLLLLSKRDIGLCYALCIVYALGKL
jgi:hypothetical protein